MKMEEIINTRIKLDKELKMALATMERSDAIYDIRKKIIENQKQCPHFDQNYNWAIIDETCPYCGFHLFIGGRD